MTKTVQKLLDKGFTPVKQTKDSTVLKSRNGIAISFNDGTVEAFLKTNPSQQNQIGEVKLRHLIESFMIIGLSITYFTTDITIFDGTSMEPTYKNHSIVVRSRASRQVAQMMVAKNAVIKFNAPNGEVNLKRIIGMPGDTLTFNERKIFVNGKLVDQDNDIHFGKQQKLAQKLRMGREMDKLASTVKLKPNEYFVMGDNRQHSIDSRDYGPISKSCILSIIDK